jgi:lysophospholipase L1-like esterase
VVVSERGLGTILRESGDGKWRVELDDDSSVDVLLSDMMLVTEAGPSLGEQGLPECSQVAWHQPDPASPSWCRHRVVLCFGDSLTEGLVRSGDPLSPYSDHLAMRLSRCAVGSATPAIVINAGLSGETTEPMARRLDGILQFLFKAKVVPDIVLILGGTNDLGDVQQDVVVENLLALHRMAHNAGAITLVLTVPVCGYNGQEDFAKEQRVHINCKLRAFATEHSDKSVLVDVAAAIPQGGSCTDLWMSDGVHMSAKGYRALADLVANTQLPSQVLSSGQ